MRNVYLFILVIILLSGCRQVKYIPVQGKNDSIYIERTEIRYDTVRIKLPSDTIYATAKDSSHLESSVAVSDAWIDDESVLHHSLRNKNVELEKEVVFQDRVVEKEIRKEIPVIQEVDRPVKYIPKFYKVTNGLFFFLISVIGGGIFLKIKRII